MSEAKPKITAEQEAALKELWATLPTMDCRGQCWDSCGPIRMTEPEHALTERAGTAIPDADFRDGAAICPALTILHQCSVYDARPSICRLWGIMESMPCTHGCRPEGRKLLTDREGYTLLAEAYRIAGDTETADAMVSAWSTPEKAAETDRKLREGREAWDFAIALERERARRRGGQIYVNGRGQLSKEKPPRVRP